METIFSSEILISTYTFTRRNSPQDQRQRVRRENLKSHKWNNSQITHLISLLTYATRNIVKLNIRGLDMAAVKLITIQAKQE
jgi:adenylate kinase